MPLTSFRFSALLSKTFVCALTLSTLSFSAASAQETNSGEAETGQNVNFSRLVVRENGGHLIGNPDAEAKLIEFVSYTCGHCATFAQQGEAAIKLLYVPTGKVSLEVRHLLRDPIDLTAAMLAHCGDPIKFPLNHSAIMVGQAKWMETASKTNQAQQARWQFGAPAARRRAIASDLGFYDIMERRGYERPELDRCLKDDTMAQNLAETSISDTETYQIKGTPSFVLNGELLDQVHGWSALQPKLDAFFQ